MNHEHLPKAALMMIEDMGEKHALAVIQAYGGLPLYIPRTPTLEMVELLGEDTAAKLSQTYPNEYWSQVPKCLKAAIAARDAKWLERYEKGEATQIQLARESGRCWLAVHKALERARAARRQEPAPPPVRRDNGQLELDL